MPCPRIYAALSLAGLVLAVASENATQAGFGPSTSAPPTESGCQASGGTYGIKTKGKSGKFEFFDERCGKGKKGSKKVEVQVDSISEVDKDGNKVGASGKVKHTLKSFAAQEFTIATNANASLDSVSGSSVTFKTGFKGMGATASMTVDTFVFDQVGTVGTPSERWTVARGDMKFNIELNNWEWCGADSECKGKGKDASEEGAFIDVVLTIKNGGAAVGISDKTEADKDGAAGKPDDKAGKPDDKAGKPTSASGADADETGTKAAGAKPDGTKAAGAKPVTTVAGATAASKGRPDVKKTTPSRVRRDSHEIGEAAGEAGEAGTFDAALEVKVKNKKKLDLGGLDMHLSDQVKVDGVWTTMPTGYPKITAKGSSVSFTFRFARFAKAAKYDPLMSTSGAASLTSPEATAAAAAVAAALAAVTTAEAEITAQECSTSTSTLCTKLRMVLVQAQATVEKANMANALAVADLTLLFAKQEYASECSGGETTGSCAATKAAVDAAADQQSAAETVNDVAKKLDNLEQASNAVDLAQQVVDLLKDAYATKCADAAATGCAALKEKLDDAEAALQAKKDTQDTGAGGDNSGCHTHATPVTMLALAVVGYMF